MERLAAAFEGSVGEIIHNVSAAATRVEFSVNSLTVTADKTAELSSVVASAVDAASSNVKSIAASTEEMASTVQEIRSRVRESAEITVKAATQAERMSGGDRGAKQSGAIEATRQVRQGEASPSSRPR